MNEILTNKQRMMIVDVLKHHYSSCCEKDKDEICLLIDFFKLYQRITASEPILHGLPAPDQLITNERTY